MYPFLEKKTIRRAICKTLQQEKSPFLPLLTPHLLACPTGQAAVGAVGKAMLCLSRGAQNHRFFSVVEFCKWLCLLLLTGCTAAPQSFQGYCTHFEKSPLNRERLQLEGTIDDAKGGPAVLFCSDKHVGVDEARRLLVATATRFLRETSDMDEHSLTLGIQFKEADGALMGDGFIAEVTLRRGKIHYYLYQGLRKQILVENYDDAFARAFGTPVPEGCFRPFSEVLQK